MMDDNEVWLQLHTLLAQLCYEDKITEDQHDAWETTIRSGPACSPE